ncbi:hypothetical protein FOZ63_028115 [Perkinsus olseni]|uniref:Uncharacterized protein n=1 Tax=Perkinsus olseni TaxID=32597 RepID=A0A7J6RZ77_PEROL|nr:hypothetical protein FOZ63_028115 [Perkinsus olseni]
MDTASLKLADAPDLHSRCWLQGVVGWMMVTSLLLGIAINISSAILSITHPLSGATSSELKEFGASADSVRILAVQICSWIAAGLAIVSLGIFTKAVKSSYNTWKTLFLFFALLSFLAQVATFCLMFSTGVALDNLFTFKQVELSDYMDANPSFTFKDPGASAKEFNCMWNEFACQLGTGNALNSACSGDVSLGQDISCTSAVKAGSTGQVDAAMVEKSLNEVCGSTGLLHGKLKGPSGKCEACVNESLGFGLAAIQPSAVLCGCFQSKHGFSASLLYADDGSLNCHFRLHGLFPRVRLPLVRRGSVAGVGICYLPSCILHQLYRRYDHDGEILWWMALSQVV